jgi:uncharacterized membrane protein YoaK (UPF0700 family)
MSLKRQNQSPEPEGPEFSYRFCPVNDYRYVRVETEPSFVRNICKPSTEFMKTDRVILTSIILSYVAGYADTSTFIGSDRLFSAHVTGNFVILPYEIATHQLAGSWLKLIAFPVFILAVFISTRMINHADDDRKAINRFMILEGILLIISGLISGIYRHQNTNPILNGLSPMMVVFAMGLQNAFGRFFAKEVFAPTTLMTGNTTQFIMDLAGYLKHKNDEKQNIKQKLIHGLYIILSFLIGCFSGAFITKAVGLGSSVFIGLLMLSLARKQKSVSSYCFDVRIPIAQCGDIKSLVS